MNTEFWNKFEQLCEMSGKTPTGVVRAVGLSSGNPSAWRAGRVPGMGVINKIAAYFGVAPAYFMGLDSEKRKKPRPGRGRAVGGRSKAVGSVQASL